MNLALFGIGKEFFDINLAKTTHSFIALRCVAID